MENELRAHIQKLIDENEVILFMKGNPEAPACGFSARAVAIMNSIGKAYSAVDILPDPRIREELSSISDWPTIPQLFVNGKLVGGSDIMVEMYDDGELAKVMGVEQPSDENRPAAVDAKPQAPALQLENKLD
ncbi:MAG: Grx4 family monothiol glutaredoxin [Actinobacteria bacterium]|nr:Grx4 family monothiol glutaredoxin [Actinomycetota bacterium]